MASIHAKHKKGPRTEEPCGGLCHTLSRGELQLSEVLDGANHLAGVAILVVVPGHNLNLIGVVVDLGNHGLGGIEQAAVTDADDVGRHDGIGVVAEALGRSSLHGSVDAVNGNVLTLNNGNQDGGGAGGNGNALSRTDQLAVQLGDNQADSLGSAGAVGNDVGSASTSTTQVALTMGAVQDHLVTGVSMHGGHDAALDSVGVVQSLSHGSQAVGGAGSSADDGVFLGQGALVHAEHNGLGLLVSGSRDNNLLGAGVDVSLSLGLAGEEAGALQNNVYTQLAPGQLSGVGVSVDGDLLAVYGDGAFAQPQRCDRRNDPERCRTSAGEPASRGWSGR